MLYFFFLSSPLLKNCFSLLTDVPEGSFIVRAHTPMSNLFSCLWFNEVDRFTPRDQLSFAYTYYKLRQMNPGKQFNLNMFKVRTSILSSFQYKRIQLKFATHTTQIFLFLLHCAMKTLLSKMLSHFLGLWKESCI